MDQVGRIVLGGARPLIDDPAARGDKQTKRKQ
jgi:hypothetical protein